MTDLLLPRTDAGVIAQFAAVLLGASALWMALRGRREARLLVAGATVFVLSLMAVRAIH